MAESPGCAAEPRGFNISSALSVTQNPQKYVDVYVFAQTEGAPGFTSVEGKWLFSFFLFLKPIID